MAPVDRRAASRQDRPQYVLVDATPGGESPEQIEGVAMYGSYAIIGLIVAVILIILLLRLLGVV